ncbi:MAG: radical SAM protein [Candidatus Eisenbacteria bacterium]|nr:radical SAM protein [Candidatus Eisenbacteria bacterium]MBU1947968.1 radical SAM protein [Candidatus Eisenbacteria bacterium]
MEKFRTKSRAHRIRRYLGAALGKPLTGPQTVSLETTHHCNLQCSFCESHGHLQKLPITATRTYRDNNSMMDLATIQRLTGELAAAGVDIVELSGKGDPIAHPDLTEIVKSIGQAGLIGALVTNGTLAKPDLPAAIVQNGLSRLTLSINAGSREIFQKSSRKDLWDNMVRFLDLVLKERDRLQTPYPWIILSHVITRENICDFGAMVQFAADHRVNEITFLVMSELPGTRELQLNADDEKMFRSHRAEWESIFRAAGVTHNLQRFQQELTTRLAPQQTMQDNPLQRKIPCYEGWTFCVIGPDGAVVPCCYCEEEILGNIHDNTFSEIWYGALYKKFRENSLGLPKTQHPICMECFTTCNAAMENCRVHNLTHPWRKISPETP